MISLLASLHPRFQGRESPTIPGWFKQLDFLREAHNIIFLGPPARGKTHLSIALGVQAARRGYRVAFATATEWVMRLGEAKPAGRLADRRGNIDPLVRASDAQDGVTAVAREETREVAAGRRDRRNGREALRVLLERFECLVHARAHQRRTTNERIQIVGSGEDLLAQLLVVLVDLQRLQRLGARAADAGAARLRSLKSPSVRTGIT